MDDIPDYGSAFVCGKSRFESEKFHVKNDKILEISCGDEHTGVVTESGRVFMFGSNNWGQLGLGHENHVEKPSCIKSLKSDRIKLIACGRYHTVVASESGNIYTFGCNSESQLGLGDNANDSFYNSPQRIRSLEQQEWRALSAGSAHSCALTESGELYVWGVNDNYELGIPSAKEQRTPRRVDLSTKITYVACGYYHTAIITKKGQLLTTGSNEYGQLGYSENSKTFELVDSFDEPVKMVTCGGAHTIVITRDGRGYAFGDGSKGQLGLGQDYLKSARPRPIKFFDKMRLAFASAGECHTAFITENGRFYSCGDNRYGKLGLNQKKYTSIQFNPKLVRKYKALKVLDVSCGGCHMILIGKANPNYRSSEDEFSSEAESTLDRRSSARNSARNRDLDMDDPLKFRSSKMVTTISSNRSSNRHNLSDSDENERTFNRTHTLTKDNSFVPLSDINMRKSLADERNRLSKKYSKDSDEEAYERLNRNRRRDDYDDYGRGKKSNFSDDDSDKDRYNSYRRTNASSQAKPSVFSTRNRRFSSDEERDTAQRLRNNPYDSDSRYPTSSAARSSSVRKPTSTLESYRRGSPSNYNRNSRTRYSDDDEKPNYQVVEYIPPSKRSQSGNLTNRSNYSTSSASTQPDKKEKKIKVCTIL